LNLSPETFALLVGVAGLAGFVDAIAGGGGLIVVPALLAAGVPPVMTLGTNKLQSACGTAVATFNFARRGHIDLKEMALPVIGSLAGSAAGAVLVQQLDPSFLSGLVPILLIAVSAYFLLSPKMSEVDQHRWLHPPAFALVAFAIGFYDGFFGPGTGSFFTIALIALMGLGLLRATASTKLLNLASNVAALAALTIGGHVIWTLGLAMAAANMTGGYFGSKAAMRFGARLIRPLLVVVSLALTAKLLADPANPIAKLIWAH
jgi:uncharacterized membrane protein YfcA